MNADRRPGLSSNPVLVAARAAVSRRRLQTVIVALVVLLSAATCVLGIGLLVASHAPFDSAFNRSVGAHVNATVKAGEPRSALVATGKAAGVTAFAGPFDQATVSIVISAQGGQGPDPLPLATVAGRSQQNGPVDHLSLESGSWLTGPGQIVLGQDYLRNQLIGSSVAVTVAGKPLKIVGIAASATGTADAWVWPTQTDVLHAAGAPRSQQLLYRFTTPDSPAALRTAFATATASLPPGLITGTSTYRAARQQSNRTLRAFVPFVVAFAILGIILSVLISVNVVNGAVVSGYRVIGVLKSLGFTPGQVIAVYVIQVLIPAVIGSLAGIGLGALLALPLLGQTDRAYDVPSADHTVPLWVLAVVLVGAPALVALAAVGPALRAGRLAAVQALTIGRAPRVGRGFRLRRRLTAMRIPRSLALGLGMPVARPARAAGSVVAIVLGVVTLVFAIGLMTSLGRVNQAFHRTDAVPVAVQIAPDGPPDPGEQQSGPVDIAAVQSAVDRQPGTARSVRLTQSSLEIAGFRQDIAVQAYQGDAAWTGHVMSAGHWYAGPDQIVLSSYLLRQSGHRIGDRVTLVGEKGQQAVTVVGEYLSGNGEFELIADAATVGRLGSLSGPATIEIGLTPGTKTSAYVAALQRLYDDEAVFVQDTAQENRGSTFAVLDALIATLTLLLGAVAGLGVLNTVLLNTRERVHDLGVLKSLGMTPNQLRVMVITSMIGLGLVAGAIAVPGGVELHHHILRAMGNASGLALTPSIIDVYSAGLLALLGSAGVGLAVLGSWPPAGWAARTRAANSLRSE